jgi:hypothetical protein
VNVALATAAVILTIQAFSFVDLIGHGRSQGGKEWAILGGITEAGSKSHGG